MVVGVFIVTTGLVVSAAVIIFGTEYVTVKAAEVILPALSVAVTARLFDPSISEIAEIDQDVVPVAIPLVPLAAFAQATVVTPALSLAVPESVIVLVVVA